jgi:hypothetical protein
VRLTFRRTARLTLRAVRLTARLALRTFLPSGIQSHLLTVKISGTHTYTTYIIGFTAASSDKMLRTLEGVSVDQNRRTITLNLSTGASEPLEFVVIEEYCARM